MSDTATIAPPEQNGAAQQVIRANRFVNASAEHLEPFYDSGQVAPGTQLSNIEVAANGYMSGILVQVDVTSSGNSATVALHEDGPFNIISEVRLADINGANLFGPMTGWDWAKVPVKLGGYAAYSNPTNFPSYSQSATGSGGTAGTESFMLRIPVQINPRDAYGALPNMNAASTFKLSFAVAALSAAFATPPNGTVTVRVRCSLETWLVPQAVDAYGHPNQTTPPGLGSYQRWLKSSAVVASGSNTIRVNNVSNLIRNLAFVYRNTSPARNDANFPDQVELRIDGYARDVIRKAEIRQRMYERYGDTADTGVYVWDYTHELDGKPGFETRELWLPTNSATRLELVGTFGAAGTLDVFVNDVIAVGGDYRQV